MKRAEQTSEMKIRLPMDIRKWLEDKARRERRSMTAQIAFELDAVRSSLAARK